MTPLIKVDLYRCFGEAYFMNPKKKRPTVEKFGTALSNFPSSYNSTMISAPSLFTMKIETKHSPET